MTDKERIELLEKQVKELQEKQKCLIKNTCSGCRHFIQHYGKGARGFFEVNCGHCIKPRIKHRSPMDKACEYFEEFEEVI